MPHENKYESDRSASPHESDNDSDRKCKPVSEFWEKPHYSNNAMIDSDPSAGQLSNFMISQITKSGHGRCARGLCGPVECTS